MIKWNFLWLIVQQSLQAVDGESEGDKTMSERRLSEAVTSTVSKKQQQPQKSTEETRSNQALQSGEADLKNSTKQQDAQAHSPALPVWLREQPEAEESTCARFSPPASFAQSEALGPVPVPVPDPVSAELLFVAGSIQQLAERCVDQADQCLVAQVQRTLAHCDATIQQAQLCLAATSSRTRSCCSSSSPPLVTPPLLLSNDDDYSADNDGM